MIERHRFARPPGLLLAGLLAALALTGCPEDEEVEPTGDAGPAPATLEFGSPTPAQGAAGVDPGGVTLEFSSAPAADGYRVFLGADYPAVEGLADDAELGEGDGSIESGQLEKGTLYFWRVEATLGDAVFESPVYSFTTTAGEGPAAPTGPMPGNGAGEVALDTALGWSAADRAERYTVYFGADPTPVAAGADAAQIADGAETTAALADALAEETRYYWRVVAHNEDGSTSSALWSFETVVPPPGPDAPEAPTGPTPAAGATGVAVDTALSWAAADGAEGYRVYFADALADVMDPASLIGETAETRIDLPAPLAEGTTWYWWVEAFNAGGTAGSAVWSFETVQPGAPGPFDYLSPEDGARVGLATVLEWRQSEGADDYAVFLSQTLADVVAGDAAALAGETDVLAFDVEGLEPDAQYFWRIEARNAAASASGPVWSFTTPAPRPPEAVGGPTPANGDGDVALDAQLGWQAAARAESYRVYFGTDATAVAGGDALLAEGAATNANPGPLAAGTTYYWRVDAVNAVGATAGPLWRFDTVPVPVPGDFANLAPENGGAVDGDGVTLRWTAAENAEGYAVFVSQTLADVVVGADDALQGEVPGTEWDAPALEPGALYYWRIEALNADGRSTTRVWSFTVALPPLPEATRDPDPANLADAVELEAVFGWGGGAGADAFDVYFGRDALAVQTATTDDEAFRGSTADPTWAMPDDVGYDETWYWRVDARNVAGVTRGVVWVFSTDDRTRAPVFRGVARGLVLGDMLRVDWQAGFDDDDEAEALTYSVYAWATDGEPDWENPIGEVVGETSMMFGRDVLGGLLDGPISVAVRGRDSEGESVMNTVELALPPTAGLPRVYVAEGGVGDGAPDAPAGDLAAALANAGNGGVVLVGGGRYEVDGAALPTGENPLVIVGGFDWAAVAPGAPDGELLAAWDPETVTSTLYREVTLTPATPAEGEEPEPDPEQTPMLTMAAGGWLGLYGLRIEDPDSLTLQALDARLSVSGNTFTYVDGIADDGEGNDTRLFTAGAVVDAALDSGTLDGWFVGNTVDYTQSLLRSAAVVRTLHVSNNRLVDVQHDLIDNWEGDVEIEPDTFEFRSDPWRVPAGGTLYLHIEANDGQRTRGILEPQLAPEDAANGGDVVLRIRGNTLRNVRGDAFELPDAGHVGAGGSVDVHAWQNVILGTSSEVIEVAVAPDRPADDEGNTYVGDSDGPVRVLVEDNHFLHGNGTGVEVRRANPGGHTIELIARRNLVTHMESEGFEIRTQLDQNRPDPLVGGAIVFIGEDNESEGVDGTFEAYLSPLVGGSYDFQFRRNRLVNDHDYGYRITWYGYESGQFAQVPADATTDRSMVVEDSFYNGEDQLVDMDVRPLAGDTSVTVERNEVYSSRQGVDFDMDDADYIGDEGAQTVAWPVASGSFALILRDNYIVADEDMFELTLRSYKPVGEVYIEGNRGLSTDDYGVDATVYDFTRAVIANNVFESYDDKAIEFDVVFQAGQPITTDLFVFHNDGRRSDDENMRLSSYYDTNRVSDETYGAMNVYIAGNSLYGSTESEGLESRVLGDSLVLVERNHIGYNDVDSDDAWEMSCNGIRRPFVRGRNNVLAYGAGAGISSERCGGTYTNNTIAYNNRDNTGRAGVDSSTNGDCDAAGCFDQSLWHSNVIAGNAWRDLDDDEYYQVPYSLIGENPYPFVPGPGVIVGDPLFDFCDDIQDLECFTFDRRSATFDAGHPGEAWNDVDGTRNDLGAFGGPWAGWIGWQGENQQMPVALLGVRPVGQLTTGQPLAAVDSTPTVVFSVDLADDAADALSVVDATGAPVAGAWAIDRNRATFTPAQPFAAGGIYTVHMGADVAGAAGEVAWAADRVAFVTAVDAVAEVEDDQALGGDPVFSVAGDLTAEVDVSDTYTLDARAGDHLRMTVFADRLAGATQDADVALRLRDADGTLLDADYDLFNPESEAQRGQDPYLEYVFAEDRQVVVEVFIEDADGAAAQSYRLDGVIAPL